MHLTIALRKAALSTEGNDEEHYLETLDFNINCIVKLSKTDTSIYLTSSFVGNLHF